MATPNRYTIDAIRQKWIAAMRSLHDAKRYFATDRNRESIERANAAGQALSSVIEYAIKLNMYRNWGILSNREQELYEYFRLPDAINELYLHQSGRQKRLYSKTLPSPKIPVSKVDFNYLRNNRADYSNNTAHKAIDLLIDDVEKAGSKIGDFLNCYITGETLKKAEDFEINPEAIVQLYDKMDGFESSDTLYVLINDNIPNFQDSLEPLSRIKWDIIIDFDPDTFDEHHFGSNYTKEELLHLLKPTDLDLPIQLTSSASSPVYYMANGWKGHDDPTEADPWKKRTKYASKFIEKAVTELGKDAVQQVFVLSLLQTKRYNNNLISFFESACYEIPVFKYIVISDASQGLAEDNPDKVEYLGVSLHDLRDFLEDQLPARKVLEKHGFLMPYRKDDVTANGTLSQADLDNYSRFIEILYTGIEQQKNTVEQNDFYIGQDPLPWKGASDEWPVVRRKIIANFTAALHNKIKDGKKQFLLTHIAGIGGTTFSRQTAFQMHENYPVVFLKKYSDTNREEIADLLERLYNKLKLPLFVFVEIPGVIERNELDSLVARINDTRPILLVGVIRKDLCNDRDSNFPLPDWGNDFPLLTEHYKGLISSMPYEKELKESKCEMCDKLQNEKRNLKTPFELGLITFDREYKGITQYVANFKNIFQAYPGVVNALEIMALCDYYGRGRVNNRLIREIFKEKEGKKFTLADKFPSLASYFQLITEEKNGEFVDLKIRHPLLSEEIIRQFLGMHPGYDSFRNNLLGISKRIIDLCADAGQAFESFVTNLFINRDPSSEERYSRIISDMRETDRIPLFRYLVEKFPNNAHFHSHLGRCYSRQSKEYGKAIEHVERAIELSSKEDYLIYHMKAECLSGLVESQARELKNIDDVTAKLDERGYSLISNLREAEEFYHKTRDLQEQRHKLSGYGYDGHISMLINVLSRIKNLNPNDSLLILKREPFSNWLETAEALLVELQHLELRDSEKAKALLDQRIVQMHELIGNFSKALELLQNKLDSNQGSNNLRRLLVGCHILRNDNKHKQYSTNLEQNKRLVHLIEENLNSQQANYKDFNLWLELIRFSDLSLEECASNVQKWSANTQLPYVHLFNFAMQTILALRGNVMAMTAAKKSLERCRFIKPNNTVIMEWVGLNEDSMQDALLQNKEGSKDKRRLIKGIVSRYERGSEAYITTKNLDIDIFFKPDRYGLDSTCLNKEVEFNLGISYDGLIAENVTREGT